MQNQPQSHGIMCVAIKCVFKAAFYRIVVLKLVRR